MIRRVPVLSLTKGMYVVDPRRGKPLRPPLYSVEGHILSAQEPLRLYEQGFRTAMVDDSRFSRDPGDMTLDDGGVKLEESSRSFPGEWNEAAALYEEGIAAAKAMHTIVREHRELDLSGVFPLFRSLVDSLRCNKNVLLSLGKLRNKDDYTYSHCVNVALYTMILGRELKVRESCLPELGAAGFFHDVGKLFVPDEVLSHPGKLSPEQFAVVREHPQRGLKYLEQLGLSRGICLAALEHHERYAGHGYPYGKKGDEISFLGQVTAVADVFDALSSKRPYKDAVPASEALSVMYKTRIEDFGPDFMEAFIAALGVFPCGSLVQLSNRYCAVVTEQNPSFRLRPKVVLLSDPYGAPVLRPRLVDLSVHLNLSIVKPVTELPCSMDVEGAVGFACL